MKNKYIIISVFIILIFNRLLNYAFNLIMYHDFSISDNDLVKIGEKSILVLSIILVIYINKINFKLKITLRNVIIFGITVLLSYYSFDSIFKYLQEQEIQVSENQVLIFLIFCLSVGLFEELFFRIFVFKSVFKSNKNLIRSTFIASLVFAFAHLGNLFNPDYFVFSVIIQIIFAFGIGFLLQSIFIKFKNLSIIVFIHGMINFFGSYKSRFLVSIDSDIEASYEFSDFITSLIFVSILSFILIVIGKYIIKSSKQYKKTNIN